MILRLHLTPHLGERRLDAIANEDVQRLKRALSTRAPKTVNNVLTVLSTLLKAAVEWNVIEHKPCTIRLLKVPKTSAVFHDFDIYERLVEAARTTDPQTHLIILLGGEAGMRLGEMIAPPWTDVDLGTRQMCVQRSDWNGQVTAPKNGRLRYIPLTVRLAAALQEHRHLKGPLVLYGDDDRPVLRRTLQNWVRRSGDRSRTAGSTCSGTPSVRTWRCEAPRPAPSRSWRGTRISRRRSATCT